MKKTKSKRASRPLSHPRVAIIMGSDSDWTVMSEAAQVMKKFGVSVDVDVVSAHRTPEKMVKFAQTAADRGIQVIIAGAGGAAHLPGMVASLTSLPVIGVPILSRNSLDGWDSLLSIAQMPAGVPVATMAINGSQNAAHLALRILGVSDPKIAHSVNRFRMELKVSVDQKSKKLRSSLL